MKVLGYLAFTGVVVAIIEILMMPSFVLFGYLLLAAVGFVMLLRDMAERAALMGVVKESFDRLGAAAERGSREAEVARRSAWFADNVVDLGAARGRAADDGHLALGYSFLDVPNPYFVLPPAALVKWGFATASQVLEAYTHARNGTAPDRWHNPMLMRDLGYMGWDRIESVARIGLLLEALDRADGASPA
jgi:hypothetical protein